MLLKPIFNLQFLRDSVAAHRRCRPRALNFSFGRTFYTLRAQAQSLGPLVAERIPVRFLRQGAARRAGLPRPAAGRTPNLLLGWMGGRARAPHSSGSKRGGRGEEGAEGRGGPQSARGWGHKESGKCLPAGYKTPAPAFNKPPRNSRPGPPKSGRARARCVRGSPRPRAGLGRGCRLEQGSEGGASPLRPGAQPRTRPRDPGARAATPTAS